MKSPSSLNNMDITTEDGQKSSKKQEEQEYISFLYILINVIVSNLGILYFGYHLSVMSLAQDTVFTVFEVKESQHNFYSSLLAAAIPFGAIFGAIIPGSFLSNSSRKNSMIFADAIGTIFGLLVLTRDINMLVLARLCAGFVIGLNSSLVLKYVNEITPISLTGVMGIVFSISLTLGIVIASLNGQFFSQNPSQEDQYCFFVLLFPLIFTISRPILFQVFFNHETPFYYILNNQPDSCKQLLQILYKSQYVDKILLEVQQEVIKQGSKDTSKSYNIKRLFIGCTLLIFQQFSGINAVIMFLGQIFQKEHFSFRMTNLLSLLSNFIYLIASILSTYFVKKYTRRAILITGSSFAGIFLLLLALLQIIDIQQISFLAFFFISCYFVAFNFSLGPVIWLYSSEILSSKEFSIATTLNWISATIVVVSIPYFDHLWPLFIFFSVVCFSCATFTLFLVKETKDKSKLEILHLYDPQQKDQGEYSSIALNTSDQKNYVD
ncbi:MFS transporter (macronuclear) [Tetrahymena thermophila SB210]|uniref:Hexose transporter 1 n=1 Tax=Tetrahymena thermophila (strain SB210) TaxID=312017 RepID=I7LUY0_TETTS|nr:MFS transporter [Tetrahymena thermophila SB210]EAR96281.2 MFS transporter [Tetrahymena thermophila SB210]|eukprot:XP_001016526.2 MFS transporter [Tetrahymena thermophila SB210]